MVLNGVSRSSRTAISARSVPGPTSTMRSPRYCGSPVSRSFARMNPFATSASKRSANGWLIRLLRLGAAVAHRHAARLRDVLLVIVQALHESRARLQAGTQALGV